MPEPRILKLRFAVYIQSNGDGSATAKFFKDEQTAEKAAGDDDERLCEDVSSHEIEIDLDSGKVISGISDSAEEEE